MGRLFNLFTASELAGRSTFLRSCPSTPGHSGLLVRILLIAALLLQGFVLAHGAVAELPDPSMPGCACAAMASAGYCCPVPAGPATGGEGCSASLGSSYCACTPSPGLPLMPSGALPVRDGGAERSPAMVAVPAATDPATLAMPTPSGSFRASPPLVITAQQVCALLCVWRS